jgi:hypothetical protein
MYEILIIFIVLVVLAMILPKENHIDNFEQVKIKLKPNPLNLNINNSNSCNTNTCNSYPDIVVPVYAPWRSYWPASSVYPYYPFYPFYYNNYYWP